MKKLIAILLSAAILNTCPVFANDDWKEKYDEVSAVEDETAYICKINQTNNTSTSLVADKNGNIIFGPLSGDIRGTDSSDRYIHADENNNYSILDGKGNILKNLSEKYENIGYIDKIQGHDAYCISIAPTKDSIKYNCGIIDIDGNILLPIEYAHIYSDFKNGLLCISIKPNTDSYEYKYGFIDENFKIVVPPEYDGSLMCGDITYIYKKNAESIDCYKFEDNAPKPYKTLNFLPSSTLNDGDFSYITLYKSETNGNNDFGCHGFADKDLNIIVEPKYDTPILFENGYAIVQRKSTEKTYIKGIGNIFNGKYGIIDKKGNEIINTEYDRIIDKKDGKFVLFKGTKKEIISLNEQIKDIQCSDWAKDSIIYGEWSEIIPNEINSDFAKNITRGEFCKLAVQTFLKSKGDWEIDDYCKIYEIDLSSNPFNDTTDKSIILANKLGIVSGKGNDKFVPDDTITRQEAAVMIVNMAKSLNYTLNADKNTKFADDSYFADWAKDSIYKVITFKGSSDVPVMAGTGENKFSPWYNYSREQAISTMVRIYDIVQLKF